MVYWINRFLGTKSSTEDLKEGEYNSVILDCRVFNDGYNEPLVLVNFLKNAMAHYEICTQRTQKLVLQCQAGLSRSNAMAVAILVGHCSFDFEDAVEYIREKVPRAQMDNTLLNCLRQILGYKIVGEFKRPTEEVKDNGKKEKEDS